MAKSLAGHLDDYLRRLESLHYSPRSVQEERYTLQRFLAWLEQHCGCGSSDTLRRQHLAAWHKHVCAGTNRQGYPLTARTINKHLTFARSFLGYLAGRGHVQRDLAGELERLREPRTLPRGVLSHAEMRKLLDGLDTTTPEGHRNRAILELLYTSGVRARELTGLDLADVDLDHGTARVLGKGNKERVVPIGRTALRFLQSYIVAVRPCFGPGPGESALFLNAGGGRFSYRSLQHLMKRVRQTQGPSAHVTAHLFRRSCATELIRGGANVYHVKELLGHESLRTLKPYTQLAIVDLKRTHGQCHPRERDEEAQR